MGRRPLVCAGRGAAALPRMPVISSLCKGQGDRSVRRRWPPGHAHGYNGHASRVYSSGQATMNEGPRIIVLNGIGSVGKSSIARALQAMTIEPFLHVKLDTFIAMLPAAYQEHHPDGFTFETVHEDGKPPLVVIRAGVVAERALQGDAARHHRHSTAGQQYDR